MRIISGDLKGKTIAFLKSSVTRPLKDSVKENIFNILKHSNLLTVNLKNSNILDLYSGIGSFGLECISRGAKQVTFVEKDKNAFSILNENLINLNIEERSTIIKENIEFFLKEGLFEKFEIIFLDPPFSDNSYLGILKTIRERKICKKNHIIIIHREKKSLDNFKDILHPLIVKQYGRSKIIFGKLI
ncbi:16S rRNA (guanine(966)-N(2))-methyltransferase RsmD [Pelagibacteraceae bacterium]|nr:16S rRNA (guanine(966)-N(2))-methyltransferase RsmD [Pelagibacteraceae bacterium]MDB9743217.1 16S rRNA (guanine(966)-N(2))-methyltransferase RsmD [Pelagibacteraceae bacterium]MDC0340022.1 16S rRNA (guanine(966)-N(2))-methyltransferase RsmD [Pelagibacteraceae bacterium]MDC0366055.1 16S rRNA (guanine(966)-N(2))-methyltransferase RsmD [Pelagibacteraceae bacterium]|tara:strand:+ start:156 stop:716 length:561 start_codon:yes stop_codon:yes gene_type:complete